MKKKIAYKKIKLNEKIYNERMKHMRLFFILSGTVAI